MTALNVAQILLGTYLSEVSEATSTFKPGYEHAELNSENNVHYFRNSSLNDNA